MVDRWYWMEADIIRTTDKAILIESEDIEAWLPLKMIQAYEGELEQGMTVRMAISFGIAESKGLIIVDRTEHTPVSPHTCASR